MALEVRVPAAAKVHDLSLTPASAMVKGGDNCPPLGVCFLTFSTNRGTHAPIHKQTNSIHKSKSGSFCVAFAVLELNI